MPYGWSDRWAALLAEHSDSLPARILRHDGSALLVACPEGIRSLQLSRSVEPAPTVGDWIAYRHDVPIAVLTRGSLLRRRTAGTEAEQAIAANIDLVLLVCGLDRPVKAGRIRRGATLAWDAGATPVVVLTKSALVDDAADVAERVASQNPGIEVVITSANEGIGLNALKTLIRTKTVTVLGESGAGKSSLLNALAGREVADVGAVRGGDAKGRHTTTSRQLHVLPDGGVLIDTPGTREVGLWVDPDAVTQTFADIDQVAADCRFADCRHDGEPGCAVEAAVARGDLTDERVGSWRALRTEAEAAALRANTYERRRRERQFARVVKDALRHKRGR